MTSTRFHGIDGEVKTELLKIEKRVSDPSRTPVVLLKARQFPGSIVRWNRSDDSLQVIGRCAVGLAGAAAESKHSSLANARGIYHLSYRET